MRWITFFVLLYFMTALQVTKLGGMPGNYWPSIEYLPMLAVFYALFAADTAAPLAALLCGLAYDIGNQDFVGINLIPLALTGWLIVRFRLSIFREHFISQLLMTLFAILAFALFSVSYRWLINAPLDGNSAWHHFGLLAGDAVYTAVVAPFFFALLFRFHNLLGFTSHGPRTRGHN